MQDEGIISKYHSFLEDQSFPCVAAKAALSRDQVKCIVVDDMSVHGEDELILTFLYDFIDEYRLASQPFHSAAVIFRKPSIKCEHQYDALLWKKLESLRAKDRVYYNHDVRVDDDPESAKYSFSLKEEALFVIGLHPSSSRKARQFEYATLVFNPHAEFDRLRQNHKYDAMKRTVRKRDQRFNGSVNPMLQDFGEQSEVYQYSGIHYDSTWKCPMKK
jgi:uncharacterized protein